METKQTSGRLTYFAALILILLAAAWAFGLFSGGDIQYSEVLTLFNEEKVKSFQVKDGKIKLELREKYKGKDKLTAVVDTQSLREDLDGIFVAQQEAGILESYAFLPDSKPGVLAKMLPYLLAGAILLFFWVLASNRANSNGSLAGFGKAKTTDGSKGEFTFEHVAGADEEKRELAELVDFLRDPRKFHSMGATIPRGILLVGPPGTGKTLLAKAVAGEAGVPFLSISGSDFVEMYVGVGASRVRDLFDQAKKVSPSIIFIDEIDAVGRRRGSGMGGGHDEREQTLNQLLVEMDGFQKTEGVIVLAATNRQDILDPALLRAGRFDRQVYVGRPDAKGREAILKIHSKDKRLDSRVDLHRVALATGGFTGADLKNLMNEAAILAVRADRPIITGEDMNEAMMKVLAGPEKRNRVQLQQDLKITAIHEAGHAVAAYFLKTQDPVHEITIIPRGQSLGMTISRPKEEFVHMTRNQMYEHIVMVLGGRVAETLYCQDITTGASQDIRRATQIAREMVAQFGMSEKIGALAYDGDEEIFVGRDYEKTKSYSEWIAGELDSETKALVDRAYDRCTTILKENGQKLLAVAEFLLAHERMSGGQFRAMMEGRPVDPEDKSDIFGEL